MQNTTAIEPDTMRPISTVTTSKKVLHHRSSEHESSTFRTPVQSQSMEKMPSEISGVMAGSKSGWGNYKDCPS